MELNGEQLQLKYIPLAKLATWDRNAKRHDVGAIMQSIQKYGFKDPPKFEPTLNDGKGGIVEGNGRATVLQAMKKEDQKPPRGIIVQDDEWFVPTLFGVDADSQAMAEAYAIDHNNLTMAGGDFDMYDMAKMWDGTAYAKLLNSLHDQNIAPVTMDSSDIEAYLRVVNGHVEGREFDESVANGVTVDATFKIKLPVAEAEPFEQALDQLLEEFPQAKKEKVI